MDQKLLSFVQSEILTPLATKLSSESVSQLSADEIQVKMMEWLSMSAPIRSAASTPRSLPRVQPKVIQEPIRFCQRKKRGTDAPCGKPCVGDCPYCRDCKKTVDASSKKKEKQAVIEPPSQSSFNEINKIDKDNFESELIMMDEAKGLYRDFSLGLAVKHTPGDPSFVVVGFYKGDMLEKSVSAQQLQTALKRGFVPDLEVMDESKSYVCEPFFRFAIRHRTDDEFTVIGRYEKDGTLVRELSGEQYKLIGQCGFVPSTKLKSEHEVDASIEVSPQEEPTHSRKKLDVSPIETADVLPSESVEEPRVPVLPKKSLKGVKRTQTTLN